ncbi:MAG: cobalt transporter CbiM [Actinobacteria bacterium]|nr:cobalt transporter CbiM [Actinomycetota bacterium]
MHIPDGYLSPQTYGPLFAIMIPVWGIASRFVKKTLKASQVPLLAIGSAFSFIIMMFNIPIPGGTTGHAVGGVLVAVLLGPWTAVIVISVALIVQAFLFGDGGITAIGANCFNMAFVMPFVGYFIYRIISKNADPLSRRHWIGASVGGYIALNIAALLTSVELGLQPLIAQTASGQPLYAPFPLKIAVPAIMIEHLFLFGFVEAVATGLVVAYLQKTDNLLSKNFERIKLFV